MVERPPRGIPSPIEQNHRHIHLLERVFDDGLVRAPKRLGLVPKKPRLRSLVLVSNNARIGRPRHQVQGMDEVIKAEQLKARLFDEFDKAPEWKLATVIGKEGLAAFARELVALHRPIIFDWAVRFGLSEVPRVSSGYVPPQARIESSASTAGPMPRPWKVRYDGPCSKCGRILSKGTAAVWDHSDRRMLCMECAS
jgi:hypothetical protein